MHRLLEVPPGAFILRERFSRMENAEALAGPLRTSTRSVTMINGLPTRKSWGLKATKEQNEQDRHRAQDDTGPPTARRLALQLRLHHPPQKAALGSSPQKGSASLGTVMDTS